MAVRQGNRATQVKVIVTEIRTAPEIWPVISVQPVNQSWASISLTISLMIMTFVMTPVGNRAK